MRVGNAASEQFQLDVYGEVIAVAFLGATLLGTIEERLWPRWRTVVEHVETIWRQPDDGIWEARGPRRHYTYSKVMAWVVFDRAVRLAERFELEAPLERWKQVRDEIHREVCEQGYDPERRTFTQYYGSKELDASVLNIPLVGFLPGTDERVTGTIDAVSRELGRDGFVSRYSTAETDDGLAGDEGQFLACSFWLVSALALNGRVEEARALFERLLGLRNDLGLLAEEYDVKRQRQVGNFPQAFSHLTLIGAATAIAEAGSKPRRERRLRICERGADAGAAAASARRLILPLALAQFICSFAGSNMNVMITDISDDLDTTVKGVQTAITLFLLIMAILMIPCSKLTDRWGRKRCFIARAHAVRDRRAAERGVAGSRRADPRQLGVRGRRHGAADPARLHPRDAVVHRHDVPRLGVRRDQRDGRHRRRRRAR